MAGRSCLGDLAWAHGTRALLLQLAFPGEASCMEAKEKPMENDRWCHLASRQRFHEYGYASFSGAQGYDMNLIGVKDLPSKGFYKGFLS